MGTFDPAAVPGWPQPQEEQVDPAEMEEFAVDLDELPEDLKIYRSRGELPQQLRRGVGIINDWAHDHRRGDVQVMIRIVDGEVEAVAVLDETPEGPQETSEESAESTSED